jgi:hypothetical protein
VVYLVLQLPLEQAQVKQLLHLNIFLVELLNIILLLERLQLMLILVPQACGTNM